MRIDSIGKHNPRITDIRRAVKEGGLTTDGLLPVEGPKLIAEAARSGLEVRDVYIRSDLQPGDDLENMKSYRLHRLAPGVFRSIQSTQTSQGVIALVHMPTFTLHDLIQGPNPLVIVMARLQDPGNVGTIMRVAESFGASGCIGLEGAASPYNPKTIRASAGSVFRLPHVWHVSSTEGLQHLRTAGLQILGSAPDAKRTPEEWDWGKPSALLIGNEGGGLNAEELQFCDAVIGIRQDVAVDSLNSAIAAAIVLYEISKQRRNPLLS